MKIERIKKISIGQAKKMIIMMMRYGNHYSQEFASDKHALNALKFNGYDISRLSEECRDINVPIPLFENFIGAVWQTGSSNSGKISKVTNRSKDVLLEGDGYIVTSNYEAQFEEMLTNLNEVNSINAPRKIQSAISIGLASIESYINSKVEEWNKTNPTDTFPDLEINHISLDVIIDRWIIKITGKSLDKSGQNWQAYKGLKKLRDDQIIHSKQSSYGIKHSELTLNLNLLKWAIAGILIDLHMLFKDKIPSKIIRFYFTGIFELNV